MQQVFLDLDDFLRFLLRLEDDATASSRLAIILTNVSVSLPPAPSSAPLLATTMLLLAEGAIVLVGT